MGWIRSTSRREVAALILKDLRDVLRDRRATFLTFIFPLLLYPLLFLGMRWFQDQKAEGVSRTIRIGISGDFAELLRFLDDDCGIDGVVNVPMEDRLLKAEFDALVEVKRGRGIDCGVQVVVRYDGAAPASMEALKRLEKVLDLYRLDLVGRRFTARGASIDPARILRLDLVDAAASGDVGKALLGRILPAVLILLFLTGGAFAAIDLIAGEKERGTLETLLVHPVSSRNIAAAKFTVVLLCSLGAVAFNLLGMMAAYWWLGGSGDGMLARVAFPEWPVLAAVCAMLLPLGVLVSGILIALSTFARTFREAQTFLVPVILIGLALSLLPAMPNVEFNPITAWIPISNIALAVRDAITGDLRDQMKGICLGFTLISTIGYAALAVQWSAGLMIREDILIADGGGPGSAETEGQRRSRRAVLAASGMLLLLYYGGSVLQAPSGPLGVTWGLAATLWGLILVPAILYPLAFRLSIPRLWALRRPARRDLLITAGLVPPVAVLMAAVLMLQDRVLPFPEGLARALREAFGAPELHPVAAVFLFALSPAVCEEVLWRGTFQGELEREGRPLKAILLTGLFFGLFHLNIYRLIPTAVLGAILAWLRWRTGSIFPSMLFHALYNALVIFALAPLMAAENPASAALQHPAALLASLGILFLAGRSLTAPGTLQRSERSPS